MKKETLLIVIFIWISISTYALNNKNRSKTKSNSSVILKASGCTPPTARKYLEFNNVSALLRNDGVMWEDKSRRKPEYEVPKGSGEYVIYAGSLWLGGKDVNNQLKLAAMTYDGNDFWSGPLQYRKATPGVIENGTLGYGSAKTNSDVCQEYDDFYITERKEVEKFNAWFECINDPNCDDNIEFPNYQIPKSIMDWPGNFNPQISGSISDLDTYDPNLAPYFDRNNDLIYNPLDGDYPWYDLTSEIDCRTNRRVTLYGDYNMWWVFNDNGNIHSCSQGDPIGMEIKAQAFAFATNDEINSMTFYNYELINRSTLTLYDTYFAVFMDADIGCSQDDYTGCDVQRGLGYAYNGDATDDGCSYGIGQNPPAIGVDFFEGPYQNNDGKDNILSSDVGAAYQDNGIPYKGLGIGYGDGIIDNERLGMKRFTYFNNTTANQNMTDPSIAPEFYGFMDGYWKDNTPFYYGGTGHQQSASTPLTRTNYCFPGDSDPLNWGLVSAGSGITPPPFLEWSEQNPNGPGSTPNTARDRRFLQSAGPFNLEPGALNNITLGVVYGKAISSDPFQSVELVRKADDKAQALFDNCFRILNGPDSPEMTIQELDKELILYLNKTESIEAYEEIDPVVLSYGYTPEESKYKFQGYLIYQLKDGSVDASKLSDPSLARLIGQCDITDNITKIVNYNFDEDLLASVPELMVDGQNNGIFHSFKVTTDAFAQGDVKLVNHKKYYYMVLSYAYNNYKTYDPADPASLDGQQFPFKGGRKSVNGGAISSYVGIPHITSAESGGTSLQAQYGTTPEITRIEGRGTGKNNVDFTIQTELEIVTNFASKEVTYKENSAPILIKVIDPLNVKRGHYKLQLNEENTPSFNASNKNLLDSCEWVLIREFNGSLDTIFSDQTIKINNEQLIPEWGISVQIEYYNPTPILGADQNNSLDAMFDLLESTIKFNDSSLNWLSGIPDLDSDTNQNWIRAGNLIEVDDISNAKFSDVYVNNGTPEVQTPLDPEERCESILNGTWTPFRFAGSNESDNGLDCHNMPVAIGSQKQARNQTKIHWTPSIDVVITRDKSKWTRSPVFEMQDNPDLSWDGNTQKGKIKHKPSVDKNGKNHLDANYNTTEGELTSATGMGWFPGYAIDITTGERLNIGFGEDSWLGNHGGNDMIFNPSAALYSNSGDYIGGGKHFIFVFRNSKNENLQRLSSVGVYDYGESLINSFEFKLWKSCIWVGNPLLNGDLNSNWYQYSESNPSSFILSDVKIRLRVANKYEALNTNDNNNDNIRDDVSAKINSNYSNSANNWNPYYSFQLNNVSTLTEDRNTLMDACSLINVVPNPYYAYSNYETHKLDNVVKIVNIPEVCTIKIYTVNGNLVRTYNKDDPSTSVDWDLKNFKGIPVASGVYLIHVEVPGICERVLKWFGAIRPPDLDEF